MRSKKQIFLNIHAQDFLNAFEILRESNDALVTNLSGGAISSSAQGAFGKRPAMGVDIVCLAFSVELHLKHVHHEVAGKVPRGHNILKLFDQLPDWARDQIVRHPEIAKYGWSDSDFQAELREISEGFEKWRYAYESSTLRYNVYFALVLIEATKAVAK